MSKRYYRVNIEISNICNLQCSFCPEVIRAKQVMAPDLFRGIVQQVAPLTQEIALHLMGDPLVHPQLDQLVEICAEFKVKIFLVTNGVLLREQESQLLLHPSFRQVNFSLHSYADNFPGRDPELYLNRIFEFTERAFKARPDLFINYRLWNFGEVRGRQPDNQDVLARVAARFQVPVPADWNLKTEKKSLFLKNRLFLHFDNEFIWPGLSLPIIGTEGKCLGLSSHFGILVDGTVVPCCLDKEGAIVLGSIKNNRLSEILSSPRAKKILAGFQANRLVEDLCQRCQYIERFNSTTTVNA